MNPSIDTTHPDELQCRHHGRRHLTFNGTSFLGKAPFGQFPVGWRGTT
jgi:hypothetical protein